MRVKNSLFSKKLLILGFSRYKIERLFKLLVEDGYMILYSFFFFNFKFILMEFF